MQYGKAVREKIEQKRFEKAYMQQSECRFKPVITRKSERILSDRGFANQDYQVSKFKTLYEDARMRHERQEKVYASCLDDECTFKPDTN